MPLPAVPLTKGSHVIAGSAVPIRALSRAEVLRMRAIAQASGDAEAFIISRSATMTEEEAITWLDSVDNDTATALVQAILEISGLATFRKPEPADGGGEGANGG